MTYSIVARDDATGELGVAVQSAMFAAGAVVPWARAGVGVVATQAIAELAYGPRCLDALASGALATESLETATAQDPLPTLRQVAVVAADGSVAASTGELCIDHAGHLVGDGFAVQANMMSTPDVWAAMAEAYSRATGPLARRLLTTLVAAQDAGGDARGVMAAAILIVGAERSEPWGGRVVDVRVDRSADPLADLARLLDAADGYQAFDRGVDALMGGDATTALAHLDAGLVVLPHEENLRFARVGAQLASGDVDGAADELRALVAVRAGWATIARSFAAKGLLEAPPGVTIEQILGSG